MPRKGTGKLIVNALAVSFIVLFFSFVTVQFSLKVTTGLIAGCTILFLIWRRPVWGLYGVIFLLPLGVFGQIPFFTPIKLVGIATTGIWVIKNIITEKSYVSAVQNRLIALFVLIAALSAFRAYNMGEVLDATLDLSMVLIFYLLIIHLIDDESKYKTALWIMFLSTILSCGGGVVSYIIGKSLFITRNEKLIGSIKYGGEVLRIHGAGNFGPNFLGSILTLLLPLTIVLFYWSKSRLEKAALGGITLIFLVADGLTYSRGAWVSLIAAAPLLFWRIRSKIHSPSKLVLSLIVLIVVVSLMPGRVFERAQSITDVETDISIKGRLSYKFATLQMVSDHPLLGVGLGNFNYATTLPEYEKYVDIPERRKDWFERSHGIYGGRAAHDMYFEVLGETGILGFAVFVLLLYCTWRTLRKARSYLGEMDTSSLLPHLYALEVGFIGLLINGFFLSNQFLEHLWFVIAVAVVLERLARREYEKRLPQ
jgi:O-antigen ligase